LIGFLDAFKAGGPQGIAMIDADLKNRLLERFNVAQRHAGISP
jgi:hypothetical protein